MVERRVTDPVRIAQLLASEVTGRTRGPLRDLDIVDADRDAGPADDGTLAYRLSVDDGGGAGRAPTASRVELFPDFVLLRIDAEGPLSTESTITAGLPADRDDIQVGEGGPDVVLEVRSGAAVKPAFDVLRAAAAARGREGTPDDPAGTPDDPA